MNTKTKISILLILALTGFYCLTSYGQTIKQVDSVYRLVLENPKDTNLLDQLYSKIDKILYSDLDTTSYFLKLHLKLCQNADYKTGEIMSLTGQGLNWENKGFYDKALGFYNHGLTLSENHYEKFQEAALLINIGNIYGRNGKYIKTIDYFIRALDIAEEIDDKRRIANITSNIGAVYYYLQNYDKALEYYKAGIKINKDNGFIKNVPIGYNSIGAILNEKSEYDSALFYLFKSRDICIEFDFKFHLMFNAIRIAESYRAKGDLINQKLYVEEAFNIAKELGETSEMADIYNNLAKIAIAEQDYNTAEEYANEALQLASSQGVVVDMMNSYWILSDLNEKRNNIHKAYESFKLFKDMSDSLFNTEKANLITEIETKYQTEKKDQQITLQEVELEKRNIEVKQKINQRNAFIGGFVLVLLLAATVLLGYTQKKKANTLLTSQKIEIEDKNVKLETANKENAEKNKKITDSIRYAKRIQEAILPLDKIIKENIEDSFVLYKPRDIVSGDFYWMEVVKEKVLFAAVDCTGHGVPGALVSIVGHNGLNQAVKEFGVTEPAKILDKLNELVLDTFSSKDEHDIKDGMDIAMCCLNTKTNTLEYAGANNPLYLIRNGKLQIYKADKQPIGKFMQRKVFTNQSIALQENDSIYIFSDGYADQFGGTEDKRFTRKQFRDLLLEINDKPMQVQKNLLEEKFNSWKKNADQIDDVLVLGMRMISV